MEALANMLMTLFPAFAFLGIVLFACDRQDKRKIELEKVKTKADYFTAFATQFQTSLLQCSTVG